MRSQHSDTSEQAVLGWEIVGRQWLCKHEDGLVLQGDQGFPRKQWGGRATACANCEIVGRNLGMQEAYSSGRPNPGSVTYREVPRLEVQCKVMTVLRMDFKKERGKIMYDVFAIMPGFNHEFPTTAWTTIHFGSHGKSTRICLIVCGCITRVLMIIKASRHSF